MTDGIKISDIPEAPQEKLEVTEARELLDRASTDPETAVEKTSDYKAAEALESAVVESIGPVESPAKIETPAITLEGAGLGGRVTIERSAEPAAIIDSNDGVAIIDSNDGTSAGAIIDSNDGISVDAIIDSNDGVAIIDSHDGTSREAIGTWPTPEAPNAAGEEIPLPPGGSNDMVNPSNTSGDSPIQGVSGVGGTRPSSDFNADMVDAQPGELRGFEEEDGAVSYAFTGDGILAPTEVADRVLDVENIILEEGETSREITQDPISASSSFEDVSGFDSGSPVQTTDGVKISAAERPLQAGTGPEIITTTNLDGRTAKIIGNVPTPGLGLPIEDDISEASDDNSELPQKPSRDDFPPGEEGDALYDREVSAYNSELAAIQSASETEGEDSTDSSGEIIVPTGSIIPGSIEAAALEIPETREPTPPDTSSESSDLPQPPNLSDYMVTKTDADGNIVVDAEGNPIYVPDMDAYNAAMAEYTAQLTAEEQQVVGQETSDAADEIQEKLDELLERRSELEVMIAKLDWEISKLESSGVVTAWGIKTAVSWLTVIENSDGTFTFGIDGGTALDLSEFNELVNRGITEMLQGKNILGGAINEIDDAIAALQALSDTEE